MPLNKFYTFLTILHIFSQKFCIAIVQKNVYYKLKVASKFLAVLVCTLDFKCSMDADGQNKRSSGFFFEYDTAVRQKDRASA